MASNSAKKEKTLIWII